MGRKRIEIGNRSNGKSMLKADNTNLKSDKNLITSALKRHSAEKALEDEKASLEILVALMSSRYNKKAGNDTTPVTPGSFWEKVRTFLSIIVLIFCLGYFLNIDFREYFNKSQNKLSLSDKDEFRGSGKFDFKSGDVLPSKQYFGREDLFREWHMACVKCIRDINGGKTKSELDEDSIYTKMNYALFGPPGTGKTFFVQTIAKKLDYDLKREHLEETKDSKYKKLLETGSKEQIDQYIKEQSSRIWFCEIQAADINGKYIGESEGNIKALFNEAREIVKEKRWKACILFFDEGDVFFSKRSSHEDAGSNSANLVKAEFLTKIGVAPTGNYFPVFVFTATNRGDEFDPAFKRRFHYQSNFGLPDFNERFRFLKLLLREFPMIDDELWLRLIASLTSNRAQSFIAEKMKNFMEKDHIKGVEKFFYKEFIQFLRHQQF